MRRSLGVTTLVAAAAVALGGCELIASVDRGQVGGGDTGTGGTESTGGSQNTGGSSLGGASGGGGAAGASATGGTSGLINTCPMEGLGGAPGTPAIPEIVGSYFSGTDDSNTFEVPEVIGSEVWAQGPAEYHSVFFYSSVDNGDNILIAQNGEDNEFFGCLWSRFVWYETDGNVYYCQDVFDAESYADAASAANGANVSDLNVGCLGGGWYRLVAQ
jgi:hypothetical protein